MGDGLTLSSPGCTHLCSSVLLSHPPQCIVIPLEGTFVFCESLFMMAYPGNCGPLAPGEQCAGRGVSTAAQAARRTLPAQEELG